jgi:hypothetical protein
MPVTTDAVCLCATMLHLHMREMPTNVDAVLVAMLHNCEMNAIGVRVDQYIFLCMWICEGHLIVEYNKTY